MAVLSNNGRLIVSLPVASTLQSTDQFIIQSVSSVNPNGITQRATYGFLLNELNSQILYNVQNSPYKFTGSFYSPDNYSSNFYTTRIRNGLTITTGGITVSSGGIGVSSGASTFQSVTATQFNGPLTGNVTGNITSTGTSNFSTIIVANTIAGNINSSGLSTFANLQMAGGIIGGLPGAITINNTPIGNTNPSTIKGTSITGSLGIKSILGLVVDSYARVTGTLTANGGLNSTKISASVGITGSIKGTFTGDVFSPTGVKVLENGTGLAKRAIFYGSASYASSSFRALTASYAFATVPTNKVNFSISSSYASRSFFSVFSVSSSYASSSHRSIFSLSSSYASSSHRSIFSVTASYATSSLRSIFSVTSSYATSSRTSLTSSYVLQAFPSFTNKVAYYDGNSITKLNDLTTQFNYPYRILYFSGSPNPSDPSSVPLNNYIVVDGYNAPLAGPGVGQSALALSLNINRATRNPPLGYLKTTYNYGPEAWNFLVYGSGSLAIQSYKESYNFSNSLYYIKYNQPVLADSTFNPIRIVNNSIYFWGDPVSYNTSMRDGALGIGVASHRITELNDNLKARLQIDVFSSSIANRGTGNWQGSGTVRDLPALLVRYGSGSNTTPLEKTFYISGSGNTYIGGILTSSQDVYVGGDLYVNGEIKGVGSSAYAKAWINFGYGYPSGPTVISSSYNIASINRNGTPGDYTITFGTPFSDKNYVMVGTATLAGAYPGAAGIAYHLGGSSTKLTLKSTTQVRINIIDNSTEGYYDPIQANIVFFGL